MWISCSCKCFSFFVSRELYANVNIFWIEVRELKLESLRNNYINANATYKVRTATSSTHKDPKKDYFLSQIALYLPKRHTVLDITFFKNIKVVIKIIVLFVSYKMFLKIFFELISLEYLLTFPYFIFAKRQQN